MHSRANTVSSLFQSCGVHDRLHIYPLREIFYFPWRRHQIEGTDNFSVSSERH